jgi:hypothetical protein
VDVHAARAKRPASIFGDELELPACGAPDVHMRKPLGQPLRRLTTERNAGRRLRSRAAGRGGNELETQRSVRWPAPADRALERDYRVHAGQGYRAAGASVAVTEGKHSGGTPLLLRTGKGRGDKRVSWKNFAMDIPLHTARLVERVLGSYCERICPPSARHAVQLDWCIAADTVTLLEVRLFCGVPGAHRQRCRSSQWKRRQAPFGAW